MIFCLTTVADAQSPGPSPVPDHMPPPNPINRSEMEGRAAHRFPQSVRIGDLIGRDLLEPREWQPVLGRIVGLVRRDDGSTEVVVRLDGWFGLTRLGVPGLHWRGIGSRLVGVPVEAVALLGEFVALMDLSPEALAARPTFAPASSSPLWPDDTIRVGLVRPFH